MLDGLSWCEQSPGSILDADVAVFPVWQADKWPKSVINQQDGLDKETYRYRLGEYVKFVNYFRIKWTTLLT